MNARNAHIQIPSPTQSEVEQLKVLIEAEQLQTAIEQGDQQEAARFVTSIRETFKPSILEQFLRAYPLDTDEGLSLMTLAEAYQRVPDAHTRNALIIDKLAERDWSAKTAKPGLLVSAAAAGLKLSGKSLTLKPLRSAILSILRMGIGAGMRVMGQAFVLGQTIKGAQSRARKLESKGYTFSYDMLGEAAYTQADADRYFKAYEDALMALVEQANAEQIESNPGISVKLSALFPRYELLNEKAAVQYLTERMLELCIVAKQHRIGLNIDAEECARLEISLDIIHSLLAAPELAGWDGLGIVVQAYNRKAYGNRSDNGVIDKLYYWAVQYDRKIMVRLVKGAYWDTEIKLAQEQGLDDFPVFTAKHHTDISYLACARKLIRYGDRIYPQFATHNAQSAACVVRWAKAANIEFELQRLHGMGEALHQEIIDTYGTGCRIYAPVGTHKDLLAYLVRRLLENGANSSFVSQLADESIEASSVVESPLNRGLIEQALPNGLEIFNPRRNSRGFDLGDRVELKKLTSERSLFLEKPYALSDTNDKTWYVRSPQDGTAVGHYMPTSLDQLDPMIVAAKLALPEWQKNSLRAHYLREVADLYERDTPEFLALLAREAGKTLQDAINEVREAVDFLRYYADQTDSLKETSARGVCVCISPWNFPLAIFTGQIAASLGAGNTVIAKPAEQTSLVAHKAVELWKEAGLPADVLQLVLGTGAQQGNHLVSNANINAVIFTGSTATAKRIDKAMATNADPDSLLVAETGGLNAMIADASALPEQVVRDVVASAFQSAGQRCSALRMLYVQRDIYPQVVEMITGAMKLLKVGNPINLETDVGPVIDAQACHSLNTYIDERRQQVIYQTTEVTASGHFVKPTLLSVNGIEDLDFERFGPILHIAPYDANELDQVIESINERGYGLTFAVHSRIKSRTQSLSQQLNVGNCYINRNQIGAIVGSQPFGGEGLSGTGPKAGGPSYLPNLLKPQTSESHWEPKDSDFISHNDIVEAWDELRARHTPAERQVELVCPGVTGEENTLYHAGRGYWLVVGDELSWHQAQSAAKAGNPTLLITQSEPPSGFDQHLPIKVLNGAITPETLALLADMSGISVSAHKHYQHQIRQALAQREGAIVPMLTDLSDSVRHHKEQHICEDTTASGGNAALLMSH